MHVFDSDDNKDWIHKDKDK